MIYGVYAIRDLKTGYMSLCTSQNDAAASRDFAHAIMQNGSIFNTHPSDFELMYLGSYDADNGEIIPCECVHKLIAKGSDYIVK